MNLRNVDLNLLVVFDTLLRIRHVTRAAAHLGIGQPGMSAALRRLRQLFGDPLLVRQGSEMVPTERALALQTQVKAALREVSRVIEPPEEFDPLTSSRTFRVRMSDLLCSLLLPKLFKQLETIAPDIHLEISHLSPTETVDCLERDTIELAISTDLDVPKSISIQRLFDEPRVVCVARRDLDIEAQLKTPKAFAALPQIKISQSPIDDRFADRQLAAQGFTRNTVLTVPHWLTVPDILLETSLVAVMPASIAARFSERQDLRVHPLRFIKTGFTWSQYWHRRNQNDPGHVWFRQLILDNCRTDPAKGKLLHLDDHRSPR